MNSGKFHSNYLRPLIAVIDSWSYRPLTDSKKLASNELSKEDWIRCIPFFLMHLFCLLAFFSGISITAIAVALGLYILRMFAITGFYHRYFSHRSFKTSRALQFVFAFIGGTAVQRGALWWAAHHRHHHIHSDGPEDTHSPHREQGFFWSHCLWFICKRNYPTNTRYIKDWLKYPELVFIDRFDSLPPFLLGLSLYLIGDFLPPSFETSGFQLLVWGFFISTIVLYHATFTINSLAHIFGTRRYKTKDNSRNNFWLAIITFGEGWHNNHHHYANSVRQGFKWWEIDFTYYAIKFMSFFGLVHDLKPVPEKIKNFDDKGVRR